MMHAITLHQPYATLIACGAKSIETRGWQAPSWLVGERIAIHAGKSKHDLALADEWPFLAYLQHVVGGGADPIGPRLPLGAVLCTAILDRCSPITRPGAAKLARSKPDEYAFGLYRLDYGPRWAWVLRDVELLPEPMPARGLQKVWRWNPDDATAAQETLL